MGGLPTPRAPSEVQDGRVISVPDSEGSGDVVYCTGGSSNKASCFIPAGQSGSFQCASNDWYCAFSFDGSGGATKTGGSGTVDSVVAINNF